MSLELLIGPMFAGKSSELIRRIRRVKVINKSYMVIKPSIDTRYSNNKIISHNKESNECYILNNLRDIYNNEYYINNNISEIFIDEAQFFTDLKDTVIELVEKYNKNIVIAGLICDFNRNKFGQILDLLPYCDMDRICPTTALCLHCMDGTLASFSNRTKKENSQVLIGESDLYSSLCRKHYNEMN